MVSDKSQVLQVAASQSQESTDWRQCVLCQSDDDKKGILVWSRIPESPHMSTYWRGDCSREGQPE